MTHKLKILSEYYYDVHIGLKPFELRKDDRGFEVGDTLILEEYDSNLKDYTGRKTTKKITYILSGGQFGLVEGYVIMAII